MDDDFWILRGMRKVFEKDHEVYIASDGESAVGRAEEIDPDVVLIDLLLGWENGLDVLEKLRPMLPDSVIVMTTSFPGVEIKHEAYASGADAFLPKEELALFSVLLDQIQRA